MSELPQVRLGSLSVSRLVCGSNPFMGYSYRSPAHDQWQRRTFTPQRISEVLEKCLEVGVNTVACNYDEGRTMAQALQVLERRCGIRMQWIAYTHGGPTFQRESIDMIADDGANACYIQGGVVDSCFQYNYVGGIVPQEGDRLDDVVEWLALIHERGMVAGLGTHQAFILREADRRGYDVDFYTTTLNSLRIYCDYHAAVMAINETAKPVLAIKTLGGGAKVTPLEGFTCALTGLKPTDMLAVGMEHEEAVEENAALVTRICATLARGRCPDREPSVEAMRLS
ncbi:MAG: hypothetical protein FJX74_02390 [Armatimonadetes bacterium]|nr:hypothetical protein [Armatimonadota bacterium]